jgi:uncharacterized protein GlcG (DUF336 family)
MKISYPMARILGAIAEEEAGALGVPMAVAIVDAEGLPLFFARMDGTLPASTDIAVGKAYTAAALRMASHEVGKLAQPGEVLYGIQHLHQGRIVLFGGGLPLRLRGRVVGGVGISGGSVEQDLQVAGPVTAALAQMEVWAEHVKGLLPGKPLALQGVFRLEVMIEKILTGMDAPQPSRDAALLAGAIILAAGEPAS